MSNPLRLRCVPALAVACLAVTLGALVAQTPVPPIASQPGPPLIQRRAVSPPGGGLSVSGQPGQLTQSSGQAAILSQNYLVKLGVKNGEATEAVEVLTASPALSFNGVLGKSPSTMVTFSGTLQETEEGSLVLQYSVGGRVPEVIESAAVATPGAAAATRLEYKDETSTGAIHVTSGSEQTLLKSGQRSYSILIVPAPKAQ